MKIGSDSFEHGRRIPAEFAMGTPDGFGGNRNPHLRWDDVPAVSYTHLDVYKRQSRIKPDPHLMIMHNEITEALQRGDHEEALRLARKFVAESPHDGKAHVLLARVERAAGEYEEALASVSYTHLDVYKRQVLGFLVDFYPTQLPLARLK